MLFRSAGETFPAGEFKSPKDALVAFGALLLDDRASFLRDVRRSGYDILKLPEDAIGVGTYLHYCSKNPRQYVEKYGPNLIGIIKKDGHHGQALYNAQWPEATAEQLKELYGTLFLLSDTQKSPKLIFFSVEIDKDPQSIVTSL